LIKKEYILKYYAINAAISILVAIILFAGNHSGFVDDAFYAFRAFVILLLINLGIFVLSYCLGRVWRKVISFVVTVLPSLLVVLYCRSINDYMPNFLFVMVSSISNLALNISFFVRLVTEKAK